MNDHVEVPASGRRLVDERLVDDRDVGDKVADGQAVVGRDIEIGRPERTEQRIEAIRLAA